MRAWRASDPVAQTRNLRVTRPPNPCFSFGADTGGRLQTKTGVAYVTDNVYTDIVSVYMTWQWKRQWGRGRAGGTVAYVPARATTVFPQKLSTFFGIITFGQCLLPPQL